MSVSPQQLSDPCTPEEEGNSNSRKRPLSPTTTAAPAAHHDQLPLPMADGIREVGFRLRAAALCQQDDDAEGALKSLLDDVARHLACAVAADVAQAPVSDFAKNVQLINTLFEVAATLATVVVSDDSLEQSRLDILYQHAVEGLDLIGGEEGNASDGGGDEGGSGQ